MTTAQQRAAREIAGELERVGHELRSAVNRAVRTIAPVRFTGPVATLFDRRLQAHLRELNAILTTMGVATDDLRIAARSGGEPALRRPSTGYVRDPGRPGRHVTAPSVTGTAPSGTDRTDPAEADRTDPAGPGQNGIGQNGTGQSGTGQSGTGQSGAGRGEQDGDARADQGGDGTPRDLPAQYRDLLPHVERAAGRHGVSPALLLALMDRETGDPRRIGFGGRDPAVSNGNDFGLMQINRAAHPAFFRDHDWTDPAQNIDYGASVIAANLRRYDGDVATAAAAYNAGPGRVDRFLAAGRTADAATTGGDYGSDVARRHDHFRRVLGEDR
jgi:hypothetical protein